MINIQSLWIELLERIMDAINKIPGLQHIAEDIFKLLDKESLMNCRLVNSSWKKILDEPKFWLKKFHSDSKLERGFSISDYDVQRSWKMIAKECNDIDDDFYVPNHDEEKLTAWENLLRQNYQNGQQIDVILKNC